MKKYILPIIVFLFFTIGCIGQLSKANCSLINCIKQNIIVASVYDHNSFVSIYGSGSAIGQMLTYPIILSLIILWIYRIHKKSKIQIK